MITYLSLAVFGCSAVPEAPTAVPAAETPPTVRAAETPVPVATAATIAAAAQEMPGLWVLQIRRQGWKPRDLEFVLEIDETGGMATVDPVFIGRTTASLTDFAVDAGTTRFSLHSAIDGDDYHFEGRRVGGTIDGTVTWNDGKRDQTERFTGFRREVRRFDVAIDRFPVEEDPRKVGVEPVLLDRLVLGAENARSDGLVVVADGKLVAARTFGGADEPSSVGSLTKEVAALAHGETDFLDGVRLRPSDFAALGQAILDGGVWTGDRIVPQTWMDSLVAPSAASDGPWTMQPDPMDRTRAQIGFGEFTEAGEGLLIYPGARLVVVRTLRRTENRYDARYDARDGMEWLGPMSDAIAADKLDLQPVPH